jgi:hypothetical protein
MFFPSASGSSPPAAMRATFSRGRATHPHVVRDAAVRERLVQALVALVQLDVLADDADAHVAASRTGD